MVEGSVVSLGRIEPGALGSPDFPAGEMPSAIVPDFVGRPVADAAAWAEDNEPGERLARDGAS